MSRYLLDTHTAILFFDGNTVMPSNVGKIIRDRTNRIYLSVISAWELTIKISIGKLHFPGDATGLMQVAQNRANPLWARFPSSSYTCWVGSVVPSPLPLLGLKVTV